MKDTTIDKCLLYSRRDNDLIVLTALQVDYSFGHGNKEFLHLEETKSHQFRTSKPKPHRILSVKEPVNFNGTMISMVSKGHYKIDQTEKLRNIEIPSSNQDLVRVRAKIQCIASCTRPDLCSPSQLMASAVVKPSPRLRKALLGLTKWCHETSEIGLQYKPLQ